VKLENPLKKWIIGIIKADGINSNNFKTKAKDRVGVKKYKDKKRCRSSFKKLKRHLLLFLKDSEGLACRQKCLSEMGIQDTSR